ncbi:MAG: hypothetical protein JWP01_1313 [Myxococcales bacterium]|nr:hypothetical protein [Myxococcales bacterium]
MSRRLVAAALALAACSSPVAPVAPDAQPHSDLVYPRLASYLIESYVSEDARDVMAKTDLLVVDAEAAALDRAPLDAIRAARPETHVLAYLTSEEIARTPSAEQPLAQARFARIPPQAWLLEPGSTVTRAISPTATQIEVADPGAFTIERPASDFYEEDEPTYLLIGGEHMRLVASEGSLLTVERGYRSTAVAHPAGARVASHVVFFAGTWMLDIASSAPAVNGRTWREELADEAASLVARGPWNGVFLDVCFSDISWLNGGLLDLDRNGVADDKAAISAQWSAGMGMLVDTLRARLGPSVPIVSNPGAQDCPHANLDGILMEGWPIGMPPAYLAFSTGEDRYTTWSERGRQLTIANAFSPKIGFGTIAEGQDEIARTDYRAMRFGLANALMGDGYYTFDNGVFGHYVTWWYDEYDGAGRGRHWLGRALGDVQLDGAIRWREFEHGLAIVNTGTTAATFSAPPGFTKLHGTQDPVHNDGRTVTAPLTIAATDAYVLARVSP